MNMKKVIICLVLAMMSVAGYAQSVVGKWVTEGGDSQVEIYQSGDKLNGKIVWLKKGDGQLDVHNPDKNMQSRKLIGVNILTLVVSAIVIFGGSHLISVSKPTSAMRFE